MRSLALAGLCAAIGLATPLHAQGVETGTDTIRVYAAAAPACVVGEVRASGEANATFVPDSAGGTVRISQLVDPQTAEPTATAIALAIPAVCNSAHRLIVESAEGGLQRAGGQPGMRGSATSFGDFLPYDVAIDWASRSVTRTSDQPIAANTQDAASGDLNIGIAIPAGGTVLTAGSYSDTILVRFEPAS